MPGFVNRSLVITLIALAVLALGSTTALAAGKDRGHEGKAPHECERIARDIERSESSLATWISEKATGQRKLNAAKKALKRAKTKAAKNRARRKKAAARKTLTEATEAITSYTSRIAASKQDATALGC